ncbi:hypothetical protein PWT90_08581 [Aphanocladium album]|nr:hypothetical protein PWT90_08581 [Aphanocladium album]
MFGLCGCSFRRRPKKIQMPSNRNVQLNVKDVPRKAETAVHDPAALPDASRISLDDFGIQSSSVPKRKSSNTIESVKEKLIRHLSHDKDSPQNAQGSPSSDREEIARRAELRRFRARRIQEELKEDYSKSLSTQNSIRSTRYLSTLIDIGLPGHGPRDAIEFSIDTGSHLPGPCPSPMPSFSSSNFRASNPSMKRWSSCPAAIRDNWNENAARFYQVSTTPGSFQSHVVSGKVSEAKSLPNLQQHGVKPPPSAKINASTTDRDSSSTLNVWLALQESQSRNSPALSSKNLRTSSVGFGRPQNTPVEQGLADTGHDAVTIPYPVHRPRNSQRRASATELQRQYIKPPSKPSSYHRYRNRSMIVPSCTKKDQSTSSSRGAIVTPETPGGISSSYYPSVMQSIQPSPSRSNSLVNFLSPKDLQSLELSPFEWHDSSSVLRSFGNSGDDRSSYVTAHDGDDGSQHSRHVDEDGTQGVDDGPADANRSLNRLFLSTLSVRKRRGNYAAIKSMSNDKFSTPKKMKNTHAERVGFPARWRSGSTSWNIPASLPKRISSKLWHQHGVDSGTPVKPIPIAQEMDKTEDAGNVTDLPSKHDLVAEARQISVTETAAQSISHD